jgi:hypothetical protein
LHFSTCNKEDKLLGIMELVSSKPKQLNSINANNLDLILPYIVDTLERYNSDLENQLEAIIQREYTAIHSSVYWKFEMRHRSISIQIPQIKIISLRRLFLKRSTHYTVRSTSKALLSTETRL